MTQSPQRPTMINGFRPEDAALLSPEKRAMVERRAEVLGPAYRLFYAEPVHLVRGQGVWLYDAEGNEYLDAYNNVASLGHCHPHVTAALARQAATLNTHTRYLHDGILDFADRLVATFPAALSQAMFTCSGSEANDLALRIAEAHTEASGVIVTDYAYHGTTRAVARMTPALGEYVTLDPAVRVVPAPRTGGGPEVGPEFARGVRAAIADLQESGLGVAAFFCDTIFSSDGVLADPPGFLAEAVSAVQAAGGLFVADEVQPGFGRTGAHMRGFTRNGVLSDIVTMGKSMGNGHPMAGLVGKPEIIESFARTSRYFNTFGGNTVSAAVGLAVLDVIENEGLIENARVVGGYLAAGLRDLATRHDCIGEVRGAGLFVGVDLIKDGALNTEITTRLVNGLRQRRILISAAGRKAAALKIRPPLVFTKQNADLLIEAVDAVLGEL
jgi:4-aminobutyrate aminotransferase-like enzyme